MAGNTGPKRTPDQRERDLPNIAEWYIKGEPQALIAVKLGLSVSQISQDLAEIRKRWRNSALINIDEAMGREMARLDLVESEAWTAWEKSKNNVRKTRTKSVPAIDATPDQTGGQFGTATAGVATAEYVETIEESSGDPRFLAVVLQCIDKRSRILGLDSPQKQAAGLLGETAKEHVLRLEGEADKNASSIVALVRALESGIDAKPAAE